MSKIKVLHIIKSLGRGGAEMLLPETLKLHDQSKFEFHYIYFLPWKDQLVEALRSNGGQVTCLAANNNLQLMMQLQNVVKYIREHNIQLIHAHLPWAGVIARRAGKRTRIPVLYTEHNKQERYHLATRWMNLFTMNDLAAIIAVSEDVAASIAKHKRKLSIPLHTVLNGVNTDTFKPGTVPSAIRAELGIAHNAPVIGTIAVFRFQKRLEIWLETAAAILQESPQTRFIVVGDGPLKKEIYTKAEQLQLAGKVFFVGLQSEVRPYLAAMDIYMMSSVFEGLPIAMLEAMSYGLPVVTTNAGGIRQVVRHETDGLMSGVDETHKLGEYALQLIRDETRRKQFGNNARHRVIEAFSLTRMVGQLEALYHKYLEKESRSR